MADLKWFKLSADFFDNRKIKYLRKMEKGTDYTLFWVRLLCLAAEVNDEGRVYVARSVGASPLSLAIATDEDVEFVSGALDAYEMLGMIIRSDSELKIKNWNYYQSMKPKSEYRCERMQGSDAEDYSCGKERRIEEKRIGKEYKENKIEDASLSYERENRENISAYRESDTESENKKAAEGGSHSPDKRESEDIYGCSCDAVGSGIENLREAGDARHGENNFPSNKASGTVCGADKPIEEESLFARIENDLKGGRLAYGDVMKNAIREVKERREWEKLSKTGEGRAPLGKESLHIQGEKRAYGEFGNVYLTDAELSAFRGKYPIRSDQLIRALSLYMAQTGKEYKEHYAALLRWAENGVDSRRDNGQHGSVGINAKRYGDFDPMEAIEMQKRRFEADIMKMRSKEGAVST